MLGAAEGPMSSGAGQAERQRPWSSSDRARERKRGSSRIKARRRRSSASRSSSSSPRLREATMGPSAASTPSRFSCLSVSCSWAARRAAKR